MNSIIKNVRLQDDKIKIDLNDIVLENINCTDMARDRISSSCKHRYFYTFKKICVW
jgi:hypothetical protein